MVFFSIETIRGLLLFFEIWLVSRFGSLDYLLQFYYMIQELSGVLQDEGGLLQAVSYGLGLQIKL